jgi:hypothetical protein
VKAHPKSSNAGRRGAVAKTIAALEDERYTAMWLGDVREFDRLFDYRHRHGAGAVRRV